MRAFARTHPKARPSDPSERLGWLQIAAEIGLPALTVRKTWTALRLPNQDWLDPSVIKRKRAESQRCLLAKVLRRETCATCGANFAWTVQHERGRKYEGRAVTCSRSCAQRLRFDRPGTR